MRRIIRRIFLRLHDICGNVADRVYQPPQDIQAERARPWFRDRGDKTLRLDYDLGPDSLVFDLGGFEGQWASDIFAKYCCPIHIFEPVPKFAEDIIQRFRRNQKIRVYRLGLGGDTFKAKISVAGDGSSLYNQQGPLIDVDIIRAADFFTQNGITHIDLLKINIEGGEYDLLEHLLKTGWVGHINDIQVQFHDNVPQAQRRMTNIQDALARTHALTYQYPFVWENWRIRKPDTK